MCVLSLTKRDAWAVRVQHPSLIFLSSTLYLPHAFSLLSYFLKSSSFPQNLQRDLDKYEPEVEELQRICDELQAGGPQPAVEEQSTALTSRFCVLKGRVIERLQVLDQAHREYMRYLEALQKCEKWIVQASFKIMTQSAGPCSTLEATQVRKLA